MDTYAITDEMQQCAKYNFIGLYENCNTLSVNFNDQFIQNMYNSSKG
mgnify:CR=1 FL=1